MTSESLNVQMLIGPCCLQISSLAGNSPTHSPELILPARQLSLSVFPCSRVTTSPQTFKSQPWDRLFFHTILRRSCGAVKSRAHCCTCLSLAAHASSPAFLASHQSSWHRQSANFSAARLPPTKWFLTYLNWSYHCVHCLLPCSVTHHFSPKSFRRF